MGLDKWWEVVYDTNMNIWIVGREDNKWWCCNRSPYPHEIVETNGYGRSLESVHNEANLLMMKHPIKRDMSKATIGYTPGIMGMGVLNAPMYIDYSETRKTPDQVWVVEAPTRYQALKIARKDWERTLLQEG